MLMAEEAAVLPPMRRLNLYTTLTRAGRWNEAAGTALAAMRGSPGDPLWPMLAARALAGASRFAQALELAELARSLCASGDDRREELADMWLSLGLCALLGRESESAVKALLRAEELHPGDSDTARHLGLALQRRQRYAEAAARYALVVDSGGGDAQTRHNHIQCLALAGDLERARLALRAWPEEAGPERALALAAVLEAGGETEAALAALADLDETAPAGLDAAAPRGEQDRERRGLLLRTRAGLLHALGREDEALAEYGAAFALLPDSESLAADLCGLLVLCGRAREAEALLDDFRRRNGPGPLPEARLALTVPPVAADAREPEAVRRRMRGLFKKDAPQLGPLAAVMPVPPFHLAFHGLDDRDLLMDLADFLLRRTSLAGLPGARPWERRSARSRREAARARAAALRPPGRRRIAFISRHFANHTVMSYFFRLLRELLPRLPKPLLLEFPQADNAFRRDLAAVSRLLTLPPRPEEAAAVIAGLDLDILVYLDLGMDPLTWSLAFARLARLQCALYGHPMTTGIPNLDLFLSPGPLEPPDGADFYSETLLPLPCLLAGFMPPPRPDPGARPAAREKKGPVYLCAQSLFKVHPEMDVALRAILEQDREAEIHFFLSARAQESAVLQGRFARSLGAEAARVRWLPQCSEEAFLATLAGADLVLDTPHFSGGGTSFKALGRGIPVLTHEGRFMRGRQTAGLYRHLGVQGCSAASLEDYVRMALDLAHSPGKRAEIAGALRQSASGLFDLGGSLRALEGLLMGAGPGDW